MTDKEKIIKELKEALDNLDITNKYRLNLIRAIEYLQEEPVSEELEEAADSYIKTHGEILGFGKQTFKAGAKWQKEQMLKKSFGATVCKYLNTFLKEMDKDAISQALREYTNGDRVRVLIIKQE